MKFKEFTTGLVPRDTTTPSRLFEENCAEYRNLSFEVTNKGATALTVTGFGGWDSIGEKLYSSVFGVIATPTDLQNNVTAEAQNNVGIRLRRLELVGTASGGSISANSTGIISTNIDDCQIFWCDATRASGTGDAEVFGIFKGSIEAISNTFELVTDATGKTPWLDCRAYGFMATEIINTGSQTLTTLSIEIRRHVLGSIAVIPFTSAVGAASTDSNPTRLIQRVRVGSSPASAPGGRNIVDWQIVDAHSIRFAITPTTAQLTFRGILKG